MAKNKYGTIKKLLDFKNSGKLYTKEALDTAFRGMNSNNSEQIIKMLGNNTDDISKIYNYVAQSSVDPINAKAYNNAVDFLVKNTQGGSYEDVADKIIGNMIDSGQDIDSIMKNIEKISKATEGNNKINIAEYMSEGRLNSVIDSYWNGPQPEEKAAKILTAADEKMYQDLFDEAEAIKKKKDLEAEAIKKKKDLFAKNKKNILSEKDTKKQYQKLVKRGLSEEEAVEKIIKQIDGTKEYRKAVVEAYGNMTWGERYKDWRSAKKYGTDNFEQKIIRQRIKAGDYVPDEALDSLRRHDIIDGTIKGAFRGNKSAMFGGIMSGAFAIADYKENRKEGKTVTESIGSAAFEFAKGEMLGLKGMLGLSAISAIPKAATTVYSEVQSMSRSMNNLQRFTPFSDAQFADTQQLATMRQSGMEMAKMANYNLQQTLMGTEARHLHR